MLDKPLRPIVEKLLDGLGQTLAEKKITANQVTWFGFIFGLLAILFLANGQYNLGLCAIIINRFFDGLDGAVARHHTISDFGGFLDITLDFIFYGGVVFGFVLANPQANALAGAFLLFCFLASGSSFLAYAIIAEKHNLKSDIFKNKSFYYYVGLAEGTETIIAFVLFCLFPAHFAPIALVFGVICLITAGARIVRGYFVFHIKEQPSSPKKDDALQEKQPTEP